MHEQDKIVWKRKHKRKAQSSLLAFTMQKHWWSPKSDKYWEDYHLFVIITAEMISRLNIDSSFNLIFQMILSSSMSIVMICCFNIILFKIKHKMFGFWGVD